MKVKFEFEFIPENGKLKIVVMIVLDSCEFIEFMQVDDESIPSHLVDCLIVSDWEVVFSDDAGIRSKRYFCMLLDIHSGISVLRLWIYLSFDCI